MSVARMNDIHILAEMIEIREGLKSEVKEDMNDKIDAFLIEKVHALFIQSHVSLL